MDKKYEVGNKENSMTQSEAIDFAREYIWDAGCFKDGKPCRAELGGKHFVLDGTLQEYQLNGNLLYYLCTTYERLSKYFGKNEVNKKDIAHLVEAWILAHPKLAVLNSGPEII